MKPYILVRYGELSTKGKNKRRFTQQLAKNIKRQIDGLGDTIVRAGHDYLEIHLDESHISEALERLKSVFGIQSYSPVYKVKKNMAAIEATVLQLLETEDLIGQTFRIATKRADHTFSLDTNAINRKLGQAVVDRFKGLKVQLKKPDITVKVEIREEAALITTKVYLGAGGLPVGTSGRALLMLSGGIDSVVAGYLAMKRGIEIEAVHFASPPYTSPQAVQKAKDLTKILTKFGGDIQFITVPFTKTQEEIKEKIPEGYLMTITRRMMFRVMNDLCAEREALAIVTGESIGQVASQTLISLDVINAMATYPVIRPLITYDKLEIIQLAKDIGSFAISILPYEDCCTVFAPPAPKTKPKSEKCDYYEESIAVSERVDDSVKGILVENIKTVGSQTELEEMDDLL
ncbi:MAG TPA: tRNA 4-thiouridine(8) synthase ThiI [Bavariicoccus seileri]|uniref:Probable tRNA sulfurtransferase n=1 Tax=Bavariicoccus seileri TaxID=549685 RepID=A0A3D4S465_9ENTE|nr:tRNA 4-thiouridine(8) synthase ThiI [Bavariicoccus seileri]